MKEPVKRYINITQDDIDKGVQCDSNKCAIALALKREYKTNDVKVCADNYPILIVNKNDLNISFKMDNDVLDFIDCYDNMDDMDIPSPKPFTLEVIE